MPPLLARVDQAILDLHHHVVQSVLLVPSVNYNWLVLSADAVTLVQELVAETRVAK